MTYYKPDKLGQKLKQLRESHNYKQVDIASAIDIKQSTYSQYENGKRTPSSTVLYRIAAYYGISIDEILKYCIDLDSDMFFDDEEENNLPDTLAEFIAFNKHKKYAALSKAEKELLFYFIRLSPESQNEMISYAKFKALNT